MTPIRFGPPSRRLFGILHPADELGQLELVGTDAVDRRERPLQDVVAPADYTRPLEREDVHRLLHDAEQRRIPSRVGAERARLRLGHGAADLAVGDPGLEVEYRLRQPLGVAVCGAEQMEGYSLRRFPAESREAGQLGDERLEERGGVLHGSGTRGVPGAGPCLR